MVICIVQKELHQILWNKSLFMKPDNQLHFTNSIINEFQQGKDYRDESFIISPDLFGITKPFISIETSYCELN